MDHCIQMWLCQLQGLLNEDGCHLGLLRLCCVLSRHDVPDGHGEDQDEGDEESLEWKRTLMIWN